MISIDDVREAAARLEGVCIRTPVRAEPRFDLECQSTVWLKCEHLQRTGSFKFRGAYNAVATMTYAELAAGICTVSSGNHAQALALAGRLLGVPVTVHMPGDAPDIKRQAVIAMGADIVTFDRYRQSQDEIAAKLSGTSGPRYVSGHDDRQIMSGAGSLGLEFFDQVHGLEALVMPVGGGGGLAGVGTVARALNPACRVIGVEPQASGVNRRSLLEGRRAVIEVPRTIADGQTLTSPGRFSFAVMRTVVDEVVLVTDYHIVRAMRLLRSVCGILAEPSGASGVAAVLAGCVRGERIGVVVTGGNISATRFEALTGGR